MTDWKAFLIQAVTSVIASGLILSGFNIFYNDFYSKPNIEVKSMVDANLVTSNITNSGRVPANHLNLLVQTPSDITNDNDKTNYKVFATDNVNYKKIGSRILNISMPRFVQGDGSLIEVTTRLGEKPDLNKFPKYTIFATFDEGSWKYTLQKPTSFLDSMLRFLMDYGIILILFFSGITLAILFLFKRTRDIIIHKIGPAFTSSTVLNAGYLGIYEGEDLSKPADLKKLSEKWLTRNRYEVMKDLLRIHHSLERDILSKEIFSTGLFSKYSEITEEKEESRSNWSFVGTEFKIYLFENLRNLVLVDGIYSKVDKRTTLILENKIETEELKRLNFEILKITKSALKEIDWMTFIKKSDKSIKI